ncbi:MAG: DNA internalization-related competence protein ComEC/Rec2 [Bacillota bacterium]
MAAARLTWGYPAAPAAWGLAAAFAVGLAWLTWVRAALKARPSTAARRHREGMVGAGPVYAWRRLAGTVLFLVATGLVGGWYYLGWRLALAGEVASLLGEPREWCGTVIREPVVREGRLEAVLRSQHVVTPARGAIHPTRDPVAATVLVRVASWNRRAPGVGEMVSVYGTAAWPSPPRNPGEFDYAGWLRAQGISAIVYAQAPGSLQVCGAGKLGPTARVAAWLRAHFLAGVRRYLPEGEGAVVEGMVLGMRSGLSPDLEEAFRRSGLIHLLAVSGSNVALVARVVRSLLGWAGVRPALAGALLGTWVFAAAASGGASVGRAAVMATVMLLGKLLGRPAHPLNSLALAVVFLTVLNASSWEDPGFWLSVAATAGILGMSGSSRFPPGPTTAESNGGARLLCVERGGLEVVLASLVRAGREVLAVTCAAQAAVLPVSLYHFQQACLVAPLSNLLVFPLVGVTTVGGMASACVASFHPALGVGFWPLGLVVRVMVHLARFWSEFPGAAVVMPAPRWPHVVAYYLVLAWWWGWLKSSLLPRRGPWTRPRVVLAVLVAVVALALGVATAPPRHVLQVVFFSVGQGDAILLWRPGGPAMLVDCGPAGDRYDAGADTVVPYLHRQGIRRLDLLVITHGHADHAGGAAAVMQNIPVRELWLGPGVVAEGPAGVVRRPEAGWSKTLAPAWEVLVLHPAPDATSGMTAAQVPGAVARPGDPGEDAEYADDGQNDMSLVLLVRYGETRIVLAGDLEREGEEVFLLQAERYCSGGIDLLKVPHHGGGTSCGEAFLQRVRPRIAVIQVGRNPFGHPCGETLRRLGQAGAQVWRTDLHGAVVARTDGCYLTVRSILPAGPGR